MLPVGVELDGDVVAVPQGVAVARPHRAAHAEVERELAHQGPGLAGVPGGAVGGAVVDDEDVDVAVHVAQLADRAADERLLVEGGHDDEDPSLAAAS